MKVILCLLLLSVCLVYGQKDEEDAGSKMIASVKAHLPPKYAVALEEIFKKFICPCMDQEKLAIWCNLIGAAVKVYESYLCA